MSGGISNDAKVVAAVLAVLNNFTFKMKKSQPTERAKAAFEELVEAGIVKKLKHGRKGVSYKRVADCDHYTKWFKRLPEKRKNRYVFPIAEAIPGTLGEFE